MSATIQKRLRYDFHLIVVAALNAALSSPATPEPVLAGGWRDIASAPKDGTKFDAWVPDAFGGHRMTGLSFGPRGNLRQNGNLTSADLPRWPTHWRPLPKPPALSPVPAPEQENGNA